jgi:hypothetical protein
VIRRGVLMGALAGGLASVLLVAANGGSPAAASAGSITLYSGQHVQTTEKLVAAFEKKTGITVNARYDDEDVFVDQIVTEGKNSPADVFYTENSPPLEYLASKGLLSSIDAFDPGAHAGQVQLARREVGRHLGPGERHGLQHLAPQGQPAAHLGDGSGPAEMEGQDRPGRVRDRLPAHRHLGRPHLRRRRRAQMARGAQGQRRQPPLPRQRDHHRRGQPGQVALGIINQYYWYRERAESGRPTCTARSPTSRPTTWATCWTSRARGSSSRPPIRPTTRSSWPSSTRPRGRRSSPTARASSTRSPRA